MARRIALPGLSLTYPPIDHAQRGFYASGIVLHFPLLWVVNVGVEYSSNWKGDLPTQCGQLQHGDSWNRRSVSPLYTPFWLDDPCTGLGFREPFF